MSNRAQRRRTEKLARIAKRNRHAEQGVVAIVLTGSPPPWKRDDAAWFTAHPRRSHRVRDELTKRGLRDVMLFAGGIIPDGDAAHLQTKGLAEEISPPDTNTAE